MPLKLDSTRLATRTATTALAALAAALPARQAAAAAWPQPKGETITIARLTVTEAPQAFDLSGRLRPGADFRKTELEVYGEHGLRESVTLIGKITWQDTIAGDGRQAGVASFEIGARTRLWTFEDASVLAAQASLTLPAREHDTAHPLITSGHADYDLRLLRGVPEALLGLAGFNDIQLAYRHRGGGPADELRLDITYGFDLSANWLLIAQSQTVASIGASKAPFRSYRSQKLSASFRWQVDSARYVEFGGLRTISGVNTVRETGAFVAVWATF